MLNKLKEKIKELIAFFGFNIISKNNLYFLRKNPFEVKKKLLNEIKNPVIIDVGAYVGDITQSYREMFPHSTIYCFEPFQESYSILKNRFQYDSKVFTLNSALNEKSGTVKFYVNKNLRTNSLFELEQEAEKNWPTSNLKQFNEEMVNSYSLDDFYQSENFDVVHLLKIDAQGSELLILKGAFEALRLGKIKIIYLEVILKPTYKQQAKFQDILTYLADSNYSLYDFYNQSYSQDGSLRQIDVIFVENNFLKGLLNF